MKKIIVIPITIISVILTFLVFVSGNPNYQGTVSTPTSYLATPYFSNEANEIFVSSVAGNMDLNSGVTMERAMPLYPDQINNVTFAVFNHTDEPIIFPNQGFGLTIFRYDDINKDWESLQLQHVPYSAPKTLPPKLENWDLEINNGWDILESDTTALGYEQIRLYVSGNGKITHKTYGGYLDVTISASP